MLTGLCDKALISLVEFEPLQDYKLETQNIQRLPLDVAVGC